MKHISKEERLEGITGYVAGNVVNIPKSWIYQAMEEHASYWKSEHDKCINLIRDLSTRINQQNIEIGELHGSLEELEAKIYDVTLERNALQDLLNKDENN